MFHLVAVIPLPLPANQQEFLVSYLWGELPLLKDIPNIPADVLLGGLKQHSHRRLCQPNGFILQSQIKPYLSVFGLIRQTLFGGFAPFTNQVPCRGSC